MLYHIASFVQLAAPSQAPIKRPWPGLESSWVYLLYFLAGLGIFLLVYLVYFAAAYIGFKRNIQEA